MHAGNVCFGAQSSLVKVYTDCDMVTRSNHRNRKLVDQLNISQLIAPIEAVTSPNKNRSFSPQQLVHISAT